MRKPPNSWTVCAAIIAFAGIALGAVFNQDDNTKHMPANSMNLEVRKVQTIAAQRKPSVVETPPDPASRTRTDPCLNDAECLQGAAIDDVISALNQRYFDRNSRCSHRTVEKHAFIFCHPPGLIAGSLFVLSPPDSEKPVLYGVNGKAIGHLDRHGPLKEIATATRWDGPSIDIPSVLRTFEGDRATSLIFARNESGCEAVANALSALAEFIGRPADQLDRGADSCVAWWDYGSVLFYAGRARVLIDPDRPDLMDQFKTVCSGIALWAISSSDEEAHTIGRRAVASSLTKQSFEIDGISRKLVVRPTELGFVECAVERSS